MMKKFFLNALSSFVGAWVAIVLASIAVVIIAIALFSNLLGGSAVQLGKNSVLEIKLSGVMVERDNGTDISLLTLLTQDLSLPVSLQSTVDAIHEAKTNDNIKAIYLNCGEIAAAPATLQALRAALLDFKTSNKKIYAYADNMGQGAYYVASVADEISLNPVGSVSFSGLGGQTLFYKNLFDKIGLEFQAVRVGKGKAAIEPYTQDTMSVVARQQSMQMLDTLWAGIKHEIAGARPVMTSEFIDTLINRDYISMKSAQYVHKTKIVDRLEYRHQFEERLAKAVGQENGKLEERITPAQLAVYIPVNQPSSDNQVAVVYACGTIDDMMGGGGINSTTLVPQILDLAEDENVKALVLRVNSPGGSAFGSEQIWEALQTFKQKGKPFVVSMGDYAASGGYYISCGADRIFANPLCITGSIGIFGLIPNVDSLMNKIGVNAEMVATNPAGLYPTFFNPLTDKQLQAMQQMVNNGYELFVTRCAEGRKMDVNKLKQIADGRPLPASMALSFGLVDELGGLEQAIAYAAKQAKMDDYNIVNYPQTEISILSMLGSMQESASCISDAFKLFSSPDPMVYADKVNNFVNSLLQVNMIRAEAPAYRIIL